MVGMKKGYQKLLNKLSETSHASSTLGGSLATDENLLNEELPEIDGLDQILALPNPLRENSLVKAICDAHRRRQKTKHSKVNIGSPNPILARWQEDSNNEQNYNSRN